MKAPSARISGATSTVRDYSQLATYIVLFDFYDSFHDKVEYF
jgi:hypothetical protein